MRARSAWMRIAGFKPPCTETWPTPVTSLRRWAIMVSARSLIWRTGMVGEVSASVITGASAGFTLA